MQLMSIQGSLTSLKTPEHIKQISRSKCKGCFQPKYDWYDWVTENAIKKNKYELLWRNPGCPNLSKLKKMIRGPFWKKQKNITNLFQGKVKRACTFPVEFGPICSNLGKQNFWQKQYEDLSSIYGPIRYVKRSEKK